MRFIDHINESINRLKQAHTKYMLGKDSSTKPKTRDKFNRQLARVVRLKSDSKVLYPCIGLGGLLPDIYGIDNKITGIENNSKVIDACKFVNYWRSNLNIVNDDYLKWKANDKYDLVIMNPPFDKGSAMIMKAVSELKDGGTIGFIMQSTWRGYKKKHVIYNNLNSIGRFESIYMLRGPSETGRLFNGINGGGIDLVVFTKSDEPNPEVYVRNTLGQEFTYNQANYPNDAPIIDPLIYDQIFDQSLPNNNFLRGFKRARKNEPSFITNVPYSNKPYNLINDKAETKNQMQPKVIFGFSLDNNPIKVINDETGDLFVENELGRYMLGNFKSSSISKLNTLLVNNNIATLVHTGCGGTIAYPPFRKEWFE